MCSGNTFQFSAVYQHHLVRFIKFLFDRLMHTCILFKLFVNCA